MALSIFWIFFGVSRVAQALHIKCGNGPLRQRPLGRRSAMAQTQRPKTALWMLRGGSGFSALQTPSSLFDGVFMGLVVAAGAAKMAVRHPKQQESASQQERRAVLSLQRRFLPVFWLLRAADWLQGPYFYEVYATKVFGGKQASLELVSRLFLAGFASTALFGPSAGRLVDANGRKLGTLCFTALYSAAALSTRSNSLATLFGGRVLSGIGTSLLFSAPEAWLVGDARRTNVSDAGLAATFSAAFAGDAVVAIAAGQLASIAAAARGPSGPFELSVAFLMVGALAASATWTENYGGAEVTRSKRTIAEAARIALSDKRIVLVGLAQAFFEGAMYVFVLQWPPALSAATSRAFPASNQVPFGKVFSCFMVCCLLGSTAFGALRNFCRVERSTLATFLVAALSMGAAAMSTLSGAPSLTALAVSFFIFELCVGVYFPSIGTLRSKYVPDSHRSVIMNLFGIPLNALVISVFLSIQKLGVAGALSVATAALALATASMAALDRSSRG